MPGKNYGTMLVFLKTQNLNIKTMKTSTKTHVVLKSIDLELKALLQQDIERFKLVKENSQPAIKKAA